MAFLVYKETAGYRRFSTTLYERLLKEDSNDYLLKWYAVNMDSKRSYGFAKELYDKFPQKRRLFSSTYDSACFMAYQRTKDPKYLRIAYKMIIDKLNSKDPYYIKYRKALLTFKEEYESMAKKAGINL